VDEAVAFEPTEGGEEGAGIDLEHPAADLLEPDADAEPCMGSSASVLRISMSSVPWTAGLGSALRLTAIYLIVYLCQTRHG
jgi:hypothetical protein